MVVFVFAVAFCVASPARDKHGGRVSLFSPQARLPARPKRWQPLLSGRKEQRRADGRFAAKQHLRSVVKDGNPSPAVISCVFLHQKLPFTIPELVQASPCRSSDGVLYMGKAASQTGVAPLQ